MLNLSILGENPFKVVPKKVKDDLENLEEIAGLK